MNIIEQHEIDIAEEVHEDIKALFNLCYDLYPANTSFYHQPPHFRYLGYDDDNRLIAQLSTSYRYVNRDGTLVKVYGISEFCVAPDHRNKGYASELLKRLITKSKTFEIDAIVSLTDSVDFYIKQGFRVVNCRVRWLMMKNNKSLGIMNRAIKESLVVYPISSLQDKAWAEDYLDLLGTMF